VDFVLSCRVAQKRVEETFLYWYAHQAQQRGAARLRAIVVPTERNGPLREMFKRLPFSVIRDEGVRQVLEMDLRDPITVPDVVRIDPRSHLPEFTRLR
jgi:predicted enzyme involved in methoxymalonyl-ACP biosynthesis